MIDSQAMDLRLNLHLADGYKSPSQRARRITEGWFAQNMYCPACPGRQLIQTRDNTRVVDFLCPACGAEFQLKAKSSLLGKKLRDAAYTPMMQRIAANLSPHFAFLQYDRIARHVENLLLVPGHFITPNVIEKCNPLSPTARRAGWVGCNILLGQIPCDGRLPVISGAQVLHQQKVRRKWKRFSWLAGKDAESRGWTADILRCVRSLGHGEFSLSRMYEFEGELAVLHPTNFNIRDKIRQQLQILRDKGVIRFLGRGHYVAI
ncbi:MAG: DpnI domain-containing protein [Planctomycetota bacterium]|nr:DpnI domain-containing protein [Planctomycetota bacterium]